MEEGQGKHKIFDSTGPDFEAKALEIFQLQYQENPVYRSYAASVHTDPQKVQTLQQIPFLPIGFFKTHPVQTGEFMPQAVFESSATTGFVRSRHFVRDLSLYEQSFVQGFEFFYGPVKNYCLLCLLPSYAERKDSSLIYMTTKLAAMTGHPDSGFYQDEKEKLISVLLDLEKRRQPTILMGVSFALLDLAEKYSLELEHCIVMETGGMKGRREELVRDELHNILKKAFHVKMVHSEYGMTELLSQAYAKTAGIFYCPPWMKILARDTDDPFEIIGASGNKPATGAINVIDLANIHSCSFIATDDLCSLYADGSFEVLGRMDNSDLRGCSLMTL